MELSVKEYASLCGKSIRTIQDNVSKGKLKAKIGTINHKEAYLLDASQLPPEAYRQLLKEKRKLEEAERQDELFDWLEIREKFGAEAETDILKRLKWVRQAINYEFEECTDQKKAALAERIGTSKRTLYRWIDAYKKEGVIGLVSKPIRKHLEKTKPEVNFRSMDESAVNFVRSLYLVNPPPKIAWVYRQLVEEAKEQGWKIGSRATCYRIIEQIEPTIKHFANFGEQEWERKLLYKMRRALEEVLANEVWNGDTHDLDFFIEVDGKPIRPQLIAWQDVRTRVIVGYAVTLQGNAYRIGRALRNGILNYGLPQIAYTDHGKDYDSEYMEQVFERLQIDHKLCKIKWPNSKPIERFFETLTNNYTRFWPGYCGSDAKKNRPVGFDEKKQCAAGKLVNMETALQLVDEAIMDYHNTVHSELGCTPFEAMEKVAKARPGSVDVQALNFTMMKKVRRKVLIDGIHFQNHEYWCHELHPLREQYVDVFYDPDDVSQLFVYHEGKFIGIAVNKRLRFLGANEEDLKAHLKAQGQEKKRIKEAIRGYRENTLEAQVEKRLRRGPSTLEGSQKNKSGKQPDHGKVTQLTGHERQAREVNRHRKVADTRRQAEQHDDLAAQYLREDAQKVFERLKEAGKA
ncbi:Mu transposase C-terminal domain-containing protein [Paenibacillus hamazuiensis]|uniref:Mu transposase C-terminal domain-containing protein n=1 Tax=Paenibacillus hamazuiensis TaxID=2936508 RepID=UPI00200F4772